MMPGREADADAAAAEAAEYIIAVDAGAPVVATQEQQDSLAALLGALDKAGTPTCRVATARIRVATAAATTVTKWWLLMLQQICHRFARTICWKIRCMV